MRRALLIAALMLLTAAAPASAGTPLHARFFYGDIARVDRIPGSEHAVDALGGFDLLVIRSPSDYAEPLQRQVVAALRERGVPLYGYAHISVSPLPVSESRVMAKIDACAAAGYTGVFFDNAGYDFHVDRARFNRVVTYAHGKGLRVFANAWQPEDLLTSLTVPAMNPTGAESALAPGDWVLLESFYYRSDNSYAEMPDSMLKYQRTVEIAHARGVRVMGLTYHDSREPYRDTTERLSSWLLAAMLGLDGWSYGTADNEVVPWHTPPPLPPGLTDYGPLGLISAAPLRWERQVGRYIFWFETAENPARRSAGYYYWRSDGADEARRGIAAPMAGDGL